MGNGVESIKEMEDFAVIVRSHLDMIGKNGLTFWKKSFGQKYS